MIKHKEFHLSTSFPFRKLFKEVKQKDAVDMLYYLIKDCERFFLINKDNYNKLSNYILKYIQTGVLYDRKNKEISQLMNESLIYIRDYIGMPQTYQTASALNCLYNTLLMTYEGIDNIPYWSCCAVSGALSAFDVDIESIHYMEDHPKYNEYTNYFISFHSTNNFVPDGTLKALLSNDHLSLAFDYLEDYYNDYNLIERDKDCLTLNVPNTKIIGKSNEELVCNIRRSYKWVPHYLKRIHGICPWKEIVHDNISN